jgi:hypothetical protein
VLPARFNYRRHFLLLACAVAVVVIMAQLDIFGTGSLLPNAAIYGALHAAALTGALNRAAPLRRKSLFILAAAALDVAALYAGILGLALLSAAALQLSARAYIAFGVCSMVGAIFYGFLIRIFWLPELTPRPILQVSSGCLLATMLVLLIENLIGRSSLWVLAAAWWCAFSGGLWIVGRAHALRSRTDA